MTDLERAFQTCCGDERLAVAIVAIDTHKYKETKMRSEEAKQAIAQARQYLWEQEGDVQAIHEALDRHLLAGDPFRRYWRNQLDLLAAEDRSEPEKQLTKDQIGELLDIGEVNARGLAEALVELGVIRLRGTKRKEGVKKGPGRAIYGFSKGFLDRLSRALEALEE